MEGMLISVNDTYRSRAKNRVPALDRCSVVVGK